MPPASLVRAGTLVALAGGAAMAALAAAGVFAAWSVLLPVAVLTLGFGIVLPAGTAGALDRHPARPDWPLRCWGSSRWGLPRRERRWPG